ncbi:MAG: DNA polymerase III subunit delta [Saprospiraceae bacterium]|nr:MAG: DNA polymerase III subunit delta [Saprospiraceae bacterium]
MYEKLLAELRKQQYRPIYLLHGEEPWFIDQIATHFETEIIPEELRDWNLTILYGRDVSASDILDVARRFPMMSQWQVVLVREAQDLKDWEPLIAYAEQPQPSTILVFCYKHKKFKSPARFLQLLNKNGVVFESKPLYENQLFDWIKKYVAERGRSIADDAVQLLIEYLGSDLSVVVHELEKLILQLPAGRPIHATHIDRFVGISREYNVFELNRAIGAKDLKRIGRILQNFSANPRRNPPFLVISNLANYFTKLYLLHHVRNKSDQDAAKAIGLRSAWQLRDFKPALRNYSLARTIQIIHLLKTYDLKSKGVDYNATGKDETALLRELIWQILA